MTYVVKEACSGRGEATTTFVDTTQTQRYPYHVLDQSHQVAIPGFQLAPLVPADGHLLGQRPLAEGSSQIQFELGTMPRP